VCVCVRGGITDRAAPKPLSTCACGGGIDDGAAPKAPGTSADPVATVIPSVAAQRQIHSKRGGSSFDDLPFGWFP
jgi:hypothetical protein